MYNCRKQRTRITSTATHTSQSAEMPLASHCYSKQHLLLRVFLPPSSAAGGGGGGGEGGLCGSGSGEAPGQVAPRTPPEARLLP